MREEFLAEALQEVSDTHIMEATLPLRKKRRWGKTVMSFAACFAVLAVGSFFLWPLLSGSNTADESAAEDIEWNGAGTSDGAESFDGYFYSDGLDGGAAQESPADWGVTMTVESVTNTGLTLVIERSGNVSAGELSTGSRFFLQREENGHWADVPYPDGEPDWTDELLVIPAEGALRQQVSWEAFYGALEAGRYRIDKEIYSASSGESIRCWAEFMVE